ncbi:MAG: DEAD/DEAH box helicase [Rikenellaceae bacterium]
MNTEQILFDNLGLSEQMLNAIKAKGFESPTQIQALCIPKLLDGTGDIIAQSQTGTGKTATFGIPILQMLDKNEPGVKAIILVPTRELAIQAAEELNSFNAETRLQVTAIYGGASMSEQLRRLSKGVNIVVGTPGRTLDHIRRGTMKLGNIKFLILDEADEMLNMGFVEDVEEIMSHTPEDRRVMLFSATMPKRIVNLADRYMKDIDMVKIEAQQLTTSLTEQIYFEVREGDKFDALTRIIDIEPEFYGIIFCRTKNSVDETVNRLLSRGYAADGLHGDVSQASREKILGKFRDKTINIMVATDVAARGIDVNNLTHVINYALPQDSESYVHRIGRTGRAGNSGTAITFITKGEMRQFGWIKRDVKAEIKREELPTAQDIVAMKRTKIMNDLNEIIVADTYMGHTEMASELLSMYSPEVALSSLLHLAYRGELDERKYPEIRSFSVDRKGTTRLFLAVGKKDGYTGRMVADMLKDKCGLSDSTINDIAVLESYSFVSVPFADAESVVRVLGEHRGRPLAEITKEKSERADRGDRGGRSDRGERRSSDRDRDRGDRRSFGGGDRGERSERRSGGYDRDRGGRSDRGERRSGGFDRDRGGRSDRGSDRGSDRRSGGYSDRGSDRRTTPSVRKSEFRGGADRDQRSRRDNDAPSMMKKESFDWSIFTQGGNSWDDRAPKGKKRK